MTEEGAVPAPSSVSSRAPPMPIDAVMERISLPVRIFALVAALAAVGAALFMFTAGRSTGPEPVAAPVVSPRQDAPVAKAATTSPRRTPAQARKTRAVAASTPKPQPKRAVAPTTPPSGFPTAVDAALRKHEIVVVSLVVPGARVDELAAAEARAGARAAGVGYLALNVLNEGVARALLTKLDGSQDPTLLILKRPDVVVLQLPGFVDRETVVQAAANAAS
jgi:hypothetical protein